MLHPYNVMPYINDLIPMDINIGLKVPNGEYSSISQIIPNATKLSKPHQKAIQILRISTNLFEPFMNRNENQQIFNGIEYKLIKTIAEKEHFELSIQFQDRASATNFSQLHLKYGSKLEFLKDKI